MKYSYLNYLIIFIAILGFLVLFFFPEPQTNFLWYSLTALFFIVLIISLIRVKNKSK